MKRKKQTGIKAGGSTISLKIAAYAVSIFFAVVILYPLLYIAATSMKDSKKLYELPPRLLPYADMLIAAHAGHHTAYVPGRYSSSGGPASGGYAPGSDSDRIPDDL